MTNCPACKSTNTERAKNDAGFFKSPSVKPVRIYPWSCLDCGFVGHYRADAPKLEPETDLLGPQELTPIGGEKE